MSNARDTSKNLKTGLNVTADGSIIDVQKNGTSVGSIGTYSGDMTVGTGDTRVRFIDSLDCVVPVSDAIGTSRDAAVDLGYSSIRYKDLYLSGGAYIGGTGSANYLNDYETGTWTVGLSGVTVSGGTTEATYVKFGNLVTAIVSFTNVTISGGNTATITGLPFTSGIRSTTSHPAFYYHQAGGYPVYGLLEKNSTNMYLQYNRSNNSWASAPIYSGSNRYVHFSITYTT